MPLIFEAGRTFIISVFHGENNYFLTIERGWDQLHQFPDAACGSEQSSSRRPGLEAIGDVLALLEINIDV